MARRRWSMGSLSTSNRRAKFWSQWTQCYHCLVTDLSIPHALRHHSFLRQVPIEEERFWVRCVCWDLIVHQRVFRDTRVIKPIEVGGDERRQGSSEVLVVDEGEIQGARGHDHLEANGSVDDADIGELLNQQLQSFERVLKGLVRDVRRVPVRAERLRVALVVQRVDEARKAVAGGDVGAMERAPHGWRAWRSASRKS